MATYHLGLGAVDPALHVHRTRHVGFYQKLSPGPTYGKLAVMDPLLTLRLRRLLAGDSFDVIHAHHFEGLLVGAMARVGRRVPLVFDAHTLLMSELPFYPLGLPHRVKRALGAWMDGWIPRLADHTVCVTDTIRAKLIGDAGLEPGRVSVISNGVEFEHFDPACQARVPAHPPTLVFTGNLAEYQGVDLMIEAFARVLNRLPEARLRIASASSFAAYEERARALGVREHIDLIIAPSFKELPQVLVSGDVAVNPRVDCDGIPVKLLNYMAAARPVVSFTTSAPGVVHGETGWLVESGNVAALADGMLRLLEDRDLAGALGEAARRYVGANCRWPIVAERCETLYRSLIAARTQ